MAQTRLWNIAKKRMLEDRGALNKEKGNLVREHKATHEEHFLSIWLRENKKGKVEEEVVMTRRSQKEETMRGKREVEEDMERSRVVISVLVCG